MIFDVRWLEGFSLHDKFKQEAASRKDIDLFGIVLTFASGVGDFWSVALEWSNSITHTIADRLSHLVYGVSGVPKINHFDIELWIEEDVFRLDITMGNSPPMSESESGDQLFEDVSCSSFWELFSLADESEEFPVLLNLHDIVEDPLYFPVGGSVDASHVEINDLNYITMPGLVRHPYLVQELLQHLLLVASLCLGFFDLLVHYLDGHSLVSDNIDAHLNSELQDSYFENLPVPSLKTTRYFSSMRGHSYRYSFGSSRMLFIYNNFWYKFVIIRWGLASLSLLPESKRFWPPLKEETSKRILSRRSFKNIDCT